VKQQHLKRANSHSILAMGCISTPFTPSGYVCGCSIKYRRVIYLLKLIKIGSKIMYERISTKCS